MSRTESRHTTHVQGTRPPSAQRPSDPPEEPATEAEAAPTPPNHAGWRVAVLLWAIMFLFLSLLALFDLVAGLFRR